MLSYLGQAKRGVEMRTRFKTRRVHKSGTEMEDSGLPGHEVVEGKTSMAVGHSMGEQLPWFCLKADQKFLSQNS